VNWQSRLRFFFGDKAKLKKIQKSFPLVVFTCAWETGILLRKPKQVTAI